MARARNIKPGFYKNEDLAECSIWARFIFPGLWMLADREGRLEDRPKRIKADLLPFDGQEVEPLLRELEANGFIVRYANEDGKFIAITKFHKHQTPHYTEKQSVIKPPDSGKPAPPIGPDPKKMDGTGGDDGGTIPGETRNDGPLKRGSKPPDSLNPDSLNPDSVAAGAATPRARPTTPGEACAAMRDAGMQAVNPSHPTLIELLEAGITAEQLGDLTREIFADKGPKPAAYVLATAAGRFKRGGSLDALKPHDRDAERAHVIKTLTGGGHAGSHHTIDGVATRVD